MEVRQPTPRVAVQPLCELWLVLQEVLHAEDGGPGLGLDALDERAPSEVVDLLLEHDFTAGTATRATRLPVQEGPSSGEIATVHLSHPL